MMDSLKKFVPQNGNQAFWLSFIICLLGCCVILFVISPITGLSKNFGAGNDGYIQLARSIVAGDGYVFEKGGSPVFHRPPLYPFFLVPVALFPEHLQRYVIVIPQSILVGFIGMMIFRIAKQLYNKNVAVTALLLFLVNPWVYWNAKNPMTSILQTFLYLFFAYFAAIELLDVFGLLKEKLKYGFIVRGIIIGLTGASLALSHAAMLAVVFIFTFILFITALCKSTKHLLAMLIMVMVTVCLIAPWTYRNWVVFNRFIPVSGGGGLDYFNGNMHWTGIEAEPRRRSEDFIDASFRIMGIEGTEKTLTHWKGFIDIKLEELANRKMIEHIKEHPALFIKKLVLNAIEYYFPAFVKPFLAVKVITAEKWALSVFYLFLWIMAIAGIFSNWRIGLFLLAGIILYAVWYFPFATFITHSLYNLGTIPFLCILSATGIVFLFSKIFNLQSLS